MDELCVIHCKLREVLLSAAIGDKKRFGNIGRVHSIFGSWIFCQEQLPNVPTARYLVNLDFYFMAEITLGNLHNKNARVSPKQQYWYQINLLIR